MKAVDARLFHDFAVAEVRGTGGAAVVAEIVTSDVH